MAPPDGAPESPVKDGEVLLGRYRIVERIAEGGHSLIFRVEDERLRRPACVKLLRFPTADPTFRALVEERFVKEAFLLARLGHPATIRILDFGYYRPRGKTDAPEIPFQVTELVAGGPLSRFVKKRGRLPPQEVLSLVAPIARALAEVHAAGVAHLDIKPQNILLARTRAGREPRLADFGIAETVEPKVATGPRQVLLYSVNWAAPEQMVGETISPACDVYSLALVVIFALTGRLVFCEPDPARAYRLRKASSDAIVDATAGLGLPDSFISFFARAIHFEPSLRVGDVMEFMRLAEELLRSLRSKTPVVSAAITTEESGPSPSESPQVDRSSPDRVTAASLWHVSEDRPTPKIAGREIRFVRVQDSVDLEVAKLRLRIAFVPVPGEKTGLHVKGLNCFVSVAGRRPSSAVTLDASTGGATLEFISAGGETLRRAELSFAAAGPSRTVVSLRQPPHPPAQDPVKGEAGPEAAHDSARPALVVPTESCRNLVALDFGPGLTCALLCEPR